MSNEKAGTAKASKMSDLLDDPSDTAENKPKSKILPPDPAEEIKVPDDLPPMAEPVKSATVRIPDRRGKRIQMTQKLYASIGVSRKFVPPLTRKRSAIYQLINMKGKIDARLQGLDQYVDPPYWGLNPSYTFQDTDETDLMKLEKTMTFFDGGTEIVYTKDHMGKTIPNSIPKVGTPEFINGQAVIDIFSQYQKFVWFELHPANLSNKWRKHSITPIFERVDTKWLNPHTEQIIMDLKRDAENYVRTLKLDELIKLAGAMQNPTINTNINPQELRVVMIHRARQNHEEVLFTTPDQKAAVKVAVIHALNMGILSFVPEHEAYYLTDDEEPMYHVPVTMDPFEALCNFLASDKGLDRLTEIRDALSFWF